MWWGITSRTTVSDHVELFNPALRLYGRLGFSALAGGGVDLLLEWRPPE